MDGADSIRPDVGTRVVKDHVENHVVKVVREMNADLATGAGDSVDNLHYAVGDELGEIREKNGLTFSGTVRVSA